MAEFKGTKGKWEVLETLVYGKKTMSIANIDRMNKTDDLVCNISPLHCKTNEDEANAKLIAAAPELLESLQKILSNFKSCIDGGNGELDTDKMD